MQVQEYGKLKPGPFFATAIGATWVFWLVPVTLGWAAWNAPAVWFLYIGGACLPITALTLAWRSGQLGNLVRRLADPRLIGAPWWSIVLMFVPMVHLLSAGLAAWIYAQPPSFAESPLAAMTAVQLASYALFILLLGPLPEEIGWRGYGLPALLNRYSPVFATVLLGIAWCVWHVPLFFLQGYYEPFGGPPAPLLFFANILVISFFYTWIFLHTQGSILAAIVFHFSVNFTGEIIPLSSEGEEIKAALLVCFALAIVSSGKRKWLNRR